MAAVQGMEHFTVLAEDLDATREFYGAILGLEEGYRPPLGFPGAWFFLTLAPTSSILPIATEVGAERRMYLPLIALVGLAMVGLAWLSRRLAHGRAIAIAFEETRHER